MGSISDLLNPVPTELPFMAGNEHVKEPELDSRRILQPRKSKVAKDIALYRVGSPEGQVRYWPCEIRCSKLEAEHKKFSLYPFGEIANFVRPIPYNSERRDLQMKTGRDRFNVWQYEFTLPNSNHEPFVVMWDYNIGLVRMTPLFKSLEYAKTMPAKMLNANPGLKDITISVTGGAIAAQGYWMPFDAAKAVAATFCYKIRHALTPLFGIDFPDLCVRFDDGDIPRWTIDPHIIQTCTEQAKRLREIALKERETVAPRAPVIGARKIAPRARTVELESGYGTDEDRNSRTFGSPLTPVSGKWSTVNTPSSAPIQARHHRQSPLIFPVASSLGVEVDSTSTMITANVDRAQLQKRARSEADADYDTTSMSSHSSEDVPVGQKRRKTLVRSDQDTAAAYLLLQLSLGDRNRIHRRTQSTHRPAST